MLRPNTMVEPVTEGVTAVGESSLTLAAAAFRTKGLSAGLNHGLASGARRGVPAHADSLLAMTEAGSGHSFEDAETLAWLRSQPGGTVNASAAQLARTWGWNRVRAGRRLRAWQAAGYIQRDGNAITVKHDETAGVTDAVTESCTAVTADRGVTEGVTEAVTDPVTRVTPVTAGVTDAVTESVTAVTADRGVTGGVTEAVTDPVTRVTPVSAVSHRRTAVA